MIKQKQKSMGNTNASEAKILDMILLQIGNQLNPLKKNTKFMGSLKLAQTS